VTGVGPRAWGPGLLHLLAAAATLFVVVAGVTSLVAYPAEVAQREAAERMVREGVPAVAAATERRLDAGRGWYVAAVRATFPTGREEVTAELAYAEEADPEQPAGWYHAPDRSWQPAPPQSRYAAPLAVVYLPSDPSTAMAARDVERSLEVGRATPWVAALTLLPAAVVLGLRRTRRWLLEPWFGDGPRPSRLVPHGTMDR
jgi:hypothetical protein